MLAARYADGRHGDRGRSPQRAARRGVLGLRRPAAGLGGGRHPGRKRRPGRESSSPGDHRRGGAPGQRGGHLVGRGTGRRPTAPGPPVRARPGRLLPARLPLVHLPAVLVHRSGLSRQPARAVGAHLGLPGHREHRPGAAGRVRHPAADRLRPAVADHARDQYLDQNKISFAYWSFNPNSGDTGGLVGDDWSTPQRAKLDAPEAAAGVLGTPAPTTPAPASRSPTPTPTRHPVPDPDVRARPLSRRPHRRSGASAPPGPAGTSPR